MKTFISIAVGLFFLFSFSFIIFESMGYTDEKYVSDFLEDILGAKGGVWKLSLSAVLLLTSDLFLPVPSSVVMTLLGHLLGFTLAAVVNVIGGLGSAVLGFYLTRRFGNKVFHKVVGDKDTARIEKFFESYGIWAILLSRSVPMLTEVISCLAGLSDMSFRRFLLASIAGLLPISIVYAWAGSYSQNGGGLEIPILIAFVIPGLGFAALKAVHYTTRKKERQS
ncbi:MAG: VTT domain-containing protein [Leptospirales bacterium]